MPKGFLETFNADTTNGASETSLDNDVNMTLDLSFLTTTSHSALLDSGDTYNSIVRDLRTCCGLLFTQTSGI